MLLRKVMFESDSSDHANTQPASKEGQYTLGQQKRATQTKSGKLEESLPSCR